MIVSKDKIKTEIDEIEYSYLHEHHQKLERGTVFFDDLIIKGYPHIKRIFSLRNGVLRNIKSKTLFLEEKIDGFNLRIAILSGKIFAFSRGGHIDHFSTYKVREMKKITDFLSANPDYVLCGEMVGNTPYTKPTKKFDVRLFIFDIMRLDGSFLDVEEKYDILDSNNIQSVPRLGCFKSNDSKSILKVAFSLYKRNAEGIVIRGELGEVFKHVNANSDLADIEECASRYFDMPSGFFHQRILRAAFFASEFGIKEKDLSKMLGKAFLVPLLTAIKKAKNEKNSFEEFEILIPNELLWLKIKKQMGNEILIEETSKRKFSSLLKVRFRKIYRKTSSLLHSYKNGKSIED